MSGASSEAWFAGQQVGLASTAVEAWLLLGATQAEAERLGATAGDRGARTVGLGARRLTPAGSDQLRWVVTDEVDGDYVVVGPTGAGDWVAAWCDRCDRVANESDAEKLCAARIESTGRHWLPVRRRLALRH